MSIPRSKVNGAHGAVRFWFSPDWSGGTGTGAPGYLFEFGDVYSPGGGWALETDPNGTGLSFVSGCNGMLTTYLAAPIGGWAQNQWHQIIFCYSSNRPCCSLTARLRPLGRDWPSSRTWRRGWRTASRWGATTTGAGQARGVFDELATFNCALAQSDVTAGYPYPAIISQPVSVSVNNGSTAFFSVAAGSATPVTYQWQTNVWYLNAIPVALANSDRVAGVTSNLLSIADVSDSDGSGNGWVNWLPISYNVILSNGAGMVTSAVVNLTVNDMAQLGTWNFATANWVGLQGQLPLLATNVSAQAAWSGTGVKVDSTNAARLVYRDVETNGSANINCRVGSIVLWFSPDWSSSSAGGTGPQDAGRFIELGSCASNEWWALLLGSDGNSLSFVTKTNAALTTNVTGTICWTNNTWHQIVLTYSPGGSALWADNAWLSNGSGVAYWPSRAVRDQGMSVGSDATGAAQIRGVLADLETYNYDVSANNNTFIGDNFNAVEPGSANYDISFGARYTSNSLVTATIDGGPSTGMMILVNTNNTNAGTWVPFNANPTINLGSGDGPKTVSFYFNSLSNLVSSCSLQIWVVTNPPVITITSPGPGTNTVNQPILQLQGNASGELSSVTCDIANSAGLLTNQPGVVLGRYYDTNLGWFTTNTFQCFDLDLTLGANQITLYATDLAGNMTTTHLTYTLDYTGKPNPVLGLYWPVDGSQICGTDFTWRGTVDDPTVSLLAQIVDANGDTNVVSGIVERNGNFWVENLPLAPGPTR